MFHFYIQVVTIIQTSLFSVQKSDKHLSEKVANGRRNPS